MATWHGVVPGDASAFRARLRAVTPLRPPAKPNKELPDLAVRHALDVLEGEVPRLFGQQKMPSHDALALTDMRGFIGSPRLAQATT
jgi:hypothetical protein